MFVTWVFDLQGTDACGADFDGCMLLFCVFGCGLWCGSGCCGWFGLRVSNGVSFADCDRRVSTVAEGEWVSSVGSKSVDVLVAEGGCLGFNEASVVDSGWLA